MTRSTPPVPDVPEWHPVHRANALLREALQNTTQSFASLEARYSVASLSDAIESVLQGPVQITYPTPLAVRLDALPVEEKRIAGLEALMRQNAPGATPTDLGMDGDKGMARLQQGELDALPAQIWDDAELELSLDGPPPLRADIPLDPELRPRQVHMQALMGDFRRSQRSASLLVVVSIVTAILLTVGGFVLAASLASPADAEQLPLDPSRSTSIAWTKPASPVAGARLETAAIAANRATKGEPLPLPATPALDAALSSAPQIILAASGRHIALGPLLPASHARYFMVRGLPQEATLSAGRQSGGGTWMVKGEYIPDLTMTVGQAAAGDYPVEVYMLESGDGPQARRSFVLRVAPPDAVALAGSPTRAVSQAAEATPTAEQPTVPAEPAALLRDRAMRLLGEGDIAAARMLLLHLAERGDGEAAYDLARTFDREMLAALGAKGVGGDPVSARDWYERASEGGNAKAAERLKILASLSGTPSD